MRRNAPASTASASSRASSGGTPGISAMRFAISSMIFCMRKHRIERGLWQGGKYSARFGLFRLASVQMDDTI